MYSVSVYSSCCIDEVLTAENTTLQHGALNNNFFSYIYSVSIQSMSSMDFTSLVCEWLLGSFITFNNNVSAKADNDEWADSDTQSGFEKIEKD